MKTNSKDKEKCCKNCANTLGFKPKRVKRYTENGCIIDIVYKQYYCRRYKRMVSKFHSCVDIDYIPF